MWVALEAPKSRAGLSHLRCFFYPARDLHPSPSPLPEVAQSPHVLLLRPEPESTRLHPSVHSQGWDLELVLVTPLNPESLNGY